MGNTDRFYEAFAHTEHVVMGRRLAKFTLRHRFWLSVFESPLVLGGEVGQVDVELASRLCAMPYATLDAAAVRMVSRRPRWWERLGYLLRSSRYRTAQEYEGMLAYFLDHGGAPETHGGGIVCGEPDGPPAAGKRRQAPDAGGALPGILSLVTGLIGRAKWTPEVVWGLGPGEAEWYLTGVLLHDGVAVPIRTASDEDFEAGLKAEREAAAAAAVTGAGVPSLLRKGDMRGEA